jgi:hypothetical protein
LGRDAAAARPIRSASGPYARAIGLNLFFRGSVSCRGETVYYVDDLQILVKWDDGRSESLRSSFADRFRLIEDEQQWSASLASSSRRLRLRPLHAAGMYRF